jgi:hypothetical protein
MYTTPVFNTKNYYYSKKQSLGQPDDIDTVKQVLIPKEVDSSTHGCLLKSAFFFNIMAIVVHLIFFCIVLSRDSSPVLITNVQYQMWVNMTEINGTSVANISSIDTDTCSNNSQGLVEKWDDLNIYPLTVESGGVNVKTFASLWFFCSFFFPVLEMIYVIYTNGKNNENLGIHSKGLQAYMTWLQTAPVLHFRYFEYTISSTLMIVALYALSGIRDIYTLIFVGVLNSMCMLFGDVADTMRRVEHMIYIQHTTVSEDNAVNMMYASIHKFVHDYKIWGYKYVLHFFGWIHVIFYWTVLLIHMSISKDNGWPCSKYSESIPDAIWSIFIVSLLIFTSFGFVQLYSFIQIGRKPHEFYKISTYTLFWYTLLSLTGKVAMGSILLATILVRS